MIRLLLFIFQNGRVLLISERKRKMRDYKAKMRLLLLITFMVAVLGSTVAQAAAKPKLNKEKATIYVGKTVTLKVNNQGKKSVTWKSSKPSVATVTKNGKVKGIKQGKAVITATVGKTKHRCTVSVRNRKIKTVTISKTKATLYIGKTLKLTAAVTPKNATIQDMNWKSSNKAVATVSQTGKVTPKKTGTVTISATTKDGTKKTVKCKVTVKKPKGFVPVRDVYIAMIGRIMVGETITLSAEITPSNATCKTLTWKSSDKSIATVNQNGVVKGIKPGEVRITATATDGSGESDFTFVEVRTDPQASVKKGLADAEKKGPAEFIKFCERNLDEVYIGHYLARSQSTLVSNGTIDVEDKYGKAVEALYQPWLDQIYRRSLACYASTKLEKMYILNQYINSMYKCYYNYDNRTRGWALCPGIACLLYEGQKNGTYLYGTCMAVAELVADMAKKLGLEADIYRESGDSYHIITLVTIDGVDYVFDPYVGSEQKMVNGERKNFDTWGLDEEWGKLIDKYGPINWAP